MEFLAMAMTTVSAFLAGVVVGWVGRSAAGSSREALVEAIVLSHSMRDRVKRVVAEQVEWAEDLFAEGRARFEARRDAASHIDDYVAPQVVDLKKKRGHAA
jgi:hypothetical protein